MSTLSAEFLATVRRWEITTESGCGISEIVGTWDQARAECRRLEIVRGGPLYIRGK